MLQYRWVWSQNNPLPAVRKVKLEEVRENLPTDTPTLSADARRRAIGLRQRHVALRESS